MRRIEEERLKENAEPIIVRNEKEISLEDYLSMPSDSIEDSYLKYYDDNGVRRSMFYLNAIPEYAIDIRTASNELPQKDEEGLNYNESHIYYIKGGVPPRLGGKADSIYRYVDLSVRIPKRLLHSDMIAIVRMHCYIDEKGHLARTELNSIRLNSPIEAEMSFHNSEDYTDPKGWHKTRIYKHTELLSKLCREQICFMEEESLRIMNDLPDFEPARCFLKPCKYRLTVPVVFNFKKSWQDNNTAKKHQ